MTGKKISPNEETALDHIVAAKTVHDDRGRVLAEADGAKLVNTESNLKMTDRRLNSMKQDKSAIEFLEYRDNRQKELERNLAKRGYLTESELNEQKKLDKQMEILDDEFVKTYEKEKKRIDKEIDKTYYISTKPYKEVLLTGAKDSVKMAVYSAFGVVLKDFITAMMQELKITYKEFGNESLKEIFTRFKDRLVAVWEDIKAKWKDIFSGSIEAGLQAFFSNLVVFIINTIFTTLKKLVQIIRAGFTSLWSAVKALCDKDTPKEDRVYAAAQIFVTGMIASVSMLASETIKTWLLAIPGLNAVLSLPIPFTGESIAEALSLCISAAGGAVLSTIALYYMDKLRNQGKIANMQVQMVAQSGVVVEYQVARSYFSVLDGFRFLSFAIEDSMRVIQKTQERINLSNQKAEDSLNDLDGYAKP
ncbi:hypothetical protein [Helicobacter fennelliae]|uniref:hypothetical protein n=1 Tax=Helicobacter fennelliae TaxID=215 RepID=UPI000E004273|nr:hypothetical protein [Helicobacter fennelliae]STQ84680.1 Domain of uncharacterised function (DUF1994) [Helicobacter fennelliae]